jgi:hypothetical protein
LNPGIVLGHAASKVQKPLRFENVTIKTQSARDPFRINGLLSSLFSWGSAFLPIDIYFSEVR